MPQKGIAEITSLNGNVTNLSGNFYEAVSQNNTNDE
jgi:alpha-acetolactate decarboxylase